jgi:hypothetical protein
MSGVSLEVEVANSRATGSECSHVRRKSGQGERGCAGLPLRRDHGDEPNGSRSLWRSTGGINVVGASLDESIDLLRTSSASASKKRAQR